jgi:hypothetical protein
MRRLDEGGALFRTAFGKEDEPGNPLWELRQELFRLDPATLGLVPTAELPHVWGLIMERGHAAGPISLVVVADGTTSLHLPTGGGVLGAGDQRTVRAASRAFLETAEAVLNLFSRESDHAFPSPGEFTVHALCYQGARMVTAGEQAVMQGTGPLSALFFAGDAVLTQIRLAADGGVAGG